VHFDDPFRRAEQEMGNSDFRVLVAPCAIAFSALYVVSDVMELAARGLTTGRACDPPRRILGALFESLVTIDVRAYAQAAEAKVRHLRTAGGEQEADLIVERDDGRVLRSKLTRP
jgi:hypothetical protein